MKKRTAKIRRKTKETQIKLDFSLDGSGHSSIQTGIPFFDHMLTLLSHHGGFDCNLTVKGDIEVDFHHTVEDVGICLGQAFKECLKEGKGIQRYASGLIPMDEALCQIALDISNRAHLTFHSQLPKSKIGQFDSELIEEFLLAFVNNARVTLHIHVLSGNNLHHIAESCFKGLGIVLGQGTSIIPQKKNAIPSTKGVL